MSGRLCLIAVFFACDSGDKSKAACHSQLQSADEHSLPATVDELSLVGYSEDTDVAQVFEKTGNAKIMQHC